MPVIGGEKVIALIFCLHFITEHHLDAGGLERLNELLPTGSLAGVLFEEQHPGSGTAHLPQHSGVIITHGRFDLDRRGVEVVYGPNPAVLGNCGCPCRQQNVSTQTPLVRGTRQRIRAPRDTRQAHVARCCEFGPNAAGIARHAST